MKKTYDLISVVWGKTYLDLFLNVVLPSYLAPGNIPKASQTRTIRCFIYTNECDRSLIVSNPSIQLLQKRIQVEICPILDQFKKFQKNKYDIKGFAQSLALKRAILDQSVVLLFNPDSLISDGTLTKTCELIEKGYSSVLCGELARVEAEKVIAYLAKQRQLNDGEISLTHQQLVDLGLNHLHLIGELFFWGKKAFCQWNSIIYWNIAQRSLLAKFFHFHPLAIDMSRITVSLPETLMPDDGGLIDFLKIEPKDQYYVEDSNELVCIELSFKNMDPLGCTSCYPKSHFLKVLTWALKYTSIEDRKNFCQKTLLFQGSENLDWPKIQKTHRKSIFLLVLCLRWINFCSHPKRYAKFILIWLGAKKIKKRAVSVMNIFTKIARRLSSIS